MGKYNIKAPDVKVPIPYIPEEEKEVDASNGKPPSVKLLLDTKGDAIPNPTDCTGPSNLQLWYYGTILQMVQKSKFPRGRTIGRRTLLFSPTSSTRNCHMHLVTVK
jgi:hypothetical protein